MEKPKARVDQNKCLGCSGCVTICPEGAIDFYDKALVVREKCVSCYLCINYCPVGAIFKEDML